MCVLLRSKFVYVCLRIAGNNFIPATYLVLLFSAEIAGNNGSPEPEPEPASYWEIQTLKTTAELKQGVEILKC